MKLVEKSALILANLLEIVLDFVSAHKKAFCFLAVDLVLLAVLLMYAMFAYNLTVSAVLVSVLF